MTESRWLWMNAAPITDAGDTSARWVAQSGTERSFDAGSKAYRQDRSPGGGECALRCAGRDGTLTRPLAATPEGQVRSIVRPGSAPRTPHSMSCSVSCEG